MSVYYAQVLLTAYVTHTHAPDSTTVFDSGTNHVPVNGLSFLDHTGRLHSGAAQDHYNTLVGMCATAVVGAGDGSKLPVPDLLLTGLGAKYPILYWACVMSVSMHVTVDYHCAYIYAYIYIIFIYTYHA